MRVCGRCECHAADGVCRLVDVMCTDECWVYGVAEYGLGFDGGGRGDMVSGKGVAALVVVRGAGPRAPRCARLVAVA